MKKYLSKKVVAAAVLGLTFFGSICIENAVHAEGTNTSVAVNVKVQQDAKGGVDWTKGANSDVTATGVGLPPENMGTRGMPLARRAAIVDAQRNLAEMIKGVQIDSDTLMQDLVIKNDTVSAKVSALVNGYRIVDEGVNPDGSYFVKLSVPMFGMTNSVAAIAIPEIPKPAVPEPMPKVDVKKTELPKTVVKEMQTATFTGVIVDASGMGLEATFSPVILDANGRGIYGMKNIDPDYAISKGMVEYSVSRDKAIASSRAGASPLVVKAIAVKGGKNSANKVNVVVSAADGDRILLANESSGMLKNCSVVFVK